MERRRLDDTRKGKVHKFHVGGVKGYIRTGEFEDGQVGELFVHMDHSEQAGPWGCIGILVSMALQRGVPLKDIVRKLSFTRFEPAGVTKNKDLRMVTSVADYVVRWLWLEYGDGQDASKESVAPPVGGA